MPEKYKYQTVINAIDRAGLYIAGIGGGLFVLGMALWFIVCACSAREIMPPSFLVAMGPAGFFIGAALFVFGSGSLRKYMAKRRMRKSLIRDGQYVMAKLSVIMPDYKVIYKGEPTYVIVLAYSDAVPGASSYTLPGVFMEFRSENLVYDPKPYLKAEYCKVYVDLEFLRDTQCTDCPYYVDLSSILDI